MAKSASYVIGLDYGTSSVRALVVRCEDGMEVASNVWPYPHGDEGVITDPSNPVLARQFPADYIEGLAHTVQGALAVAETGPGFRRDLIVGIGVDTTGSTPIPVDERCRPLTEQSRFADNPNAMAWLWKDHTAFAEAGEITRKSDEDGLPYMRMVGGTYSSEWFWSKLLHCARIDPEVFAAAHSWVECQDFVPGYLVGVTHPSQLRRGVCAAGHKALFNPEWGGLPSSEFLASLDPRLGDLRSRLYCEAFASDTEAGKLAPGVAETLGLPAGISVCVGAFDAHMGAVGSGIRPGTLVKVMGTSCCDIAVADGETGFIPGMCGVVRGSVLPSMMGIEAGQSAIGDLYQWVAGRLCPPEFREPDAHVALTQEALKLRPGQSGLLALDWNNGNRTILVDQRLTGLLIGQTLHTTAPEIYRAVVEATAFGALTIMRQMEMYGARIDSVVNCGGISEKSALVMQIYADVCNRPMKISRSAQSCALGAAIFASVTGGAHPDVAAAQAAMTGIKERVFVPDPESVAVYARLYRLYMQLHDAFGGVEKSADLGQLMKDLLEIRDSAFRGLR